MVAFAVKEFRSVSGFDGGPDTACLTGGEEIGEELTLGFRVTEDDLKETGRSSSPKTSDAFGGTSA